MVEKLLVPGALYHKMKKVLFAHNFVQPSFILILLFMPGPCRVKEVRGEERTIKSLPIKMFLRRIFFLLHLQRTYFDSIAAPSMLPILFTESSSGKELMEGIGSKA
ncbi:hypothetical protein FCV25MIE_17035 [Fagus crenata]